MNFLISFILYIILVNCHNNENIKNKFILPIKKKKVSINEENPLVYIRGGNDENLQDFEESSVLVKTLKSLQKTPPITLSYLSISAFATIMCGILYDNDWPSTMKLKWDAVQKGELWRLITPFFYFGPIMFVSGFFIFDVHALCVDIYVCIGEVVT
eukprot:GHVL01026408.1.p2 GENE.GHVL01026408.1~~GHVL01026408.1.p2  ORF type:complete len:156 (+),score=36.50 GHVL01026408.1:15-482(+)